MSQAKKFGTFGGVFTPSILTILGVIMYLRMGWVVGHAGLLGTLAIIAIAHFVSISTGLSISSIATDKKVGAGGVYYVLSRSLGLPIGGALGLTLFVATALSIALYMVGFAEIFNEFMANRFTGGEGFGYMLNEQGQMVEAPDFKYWIRVTGSLGLLVLTIIALISTSIAIKTQYIILGAIALSLFSIFFGDGSTATVIQTEGGFNEKVGFFAIFAVFFPAVTGFTAGVAMSGDLKDPKRSIPVGTLGSIAVGLITYLLLAIFMHYTLAPEVLKANPKALVEMAIVPGLVYAGVFGATLSSALGGILGGPRILQAMSVDKITPAIFGEGVGKDNEPRNALILTVLIAWAGVLIGELNVIAEVVSMFYLSAYGFINLSFFLESWASSDFNPTFKVNKWIGLFGFLITFTVMSQLNVLAMLVAIIIIGGIFYFLSRRQIALGTGDIWQSVWATIVKKGLKRMEAKQDHKRNWKPNTLLFSTGTKNRSKMIEFSKAVSGQTGIITNFDLIENENASVLFPKNKEAVTDEDLEKYGIFGRKLEVQNRFRGIESIACTFGFSGIEPNTVLMAWPGETEHPIWFTQMTQKLIDLDYNVLYLDYDERYGFRKQERIDLWWRGVSNNSELMLLLAKFILASPDWSHASVRVLLVNNTNVDHKVIENRIQYVLDQFRVTAEIKIVNNEIDKKPIYELMKIHSSEADLVFVGIPEIQEDQAEKFVETTNNLVRTIGTTLLVKASSQFETTDLKVEHIDIKAETEKIDEANVIPLNACRDPKFNETAIKFDAQLNRIVHELTENSVERIENYHHRIFSQVIDVMDQFLKDVSADEQMEVLHEKLNEALGQVDHIFKDASENQLPIVSAEFDKDITLYIKHKEDFIKHLPSNIEVSKVLDGNNELKDAKRKVKFRMAVQRIWFSEGMLESYDQFLEFGYQNLILLHQSKNLLHKVIWDYLQAIRDKDELKSKVLELKKRLDQAFNEIDQDALNLSANFYKRIRNKERENINQLNEIILDKKYKNLLMQTYKATSPSTIKSVRKELIAFPKHWERNIGVFTNHLIGDIQLMRLSAKIQAFTNESVKHTEENYLKGLYHNIEGLQSAIQELQSAVDQGDEKAILEKDVMLAEEIFLNSELVVGKLVDSIDKALEDMDEELELMTAQSINSIRNHQGKDVQTTVVGVRDIAEYLVKKNFEDPIHEHIQLFYDQLKRAIGKLINGSNIVQSAIDGYALNGKIEPLKEAMMNAASEIEECQSQVQTARDAFFIELRDRREALRKELDINQIIEQLDSLAQYVKQHKRRRGIKDVLKSFNQVVGNKVRAGLNYFVQRQQDLTATNYKRRFKSAVSEQGILGDFMDDISPKTELPFYYQQLYMATAFNEGGALDNRASEIKQIQSAIQRIDQGAVGGIIILGGASSGKTFLTTHVANFMLKGKTYHLHPPIDKKRKKDDLLRAVKRATSSKEGMNEIMNSVPAGSTFVIQDLERWWLKTKDGEVILNEIAKVIKEYGHLHYFVLNANIHAYQLMVEHSHIQSAIARSIILAPLTVSQIRDAIWSRHKTGGLIAHINGTSERHLSVNKVNKYLAKFHSTSNGVVGMALSQWLSVIQEKKDNDLFLDNPRTIDFPALIRVELKNLIYQLFIHHSLNRKELLMIYGKEHKNWIERSVLSLLHAGILTVNEREELSITTIAKPYIENWLNELGFIK